ncbi:chloride channel protein [Faecalibacterium hattorii]|uniref:chloride channel protein n=1 Tax=Faecalibacterium hattorii TaxID=2935520 RepID=UPI003AADE64D
MGGSIGWNLGTLLRLKDHDRRTATISGMAAFFSALFGTPLAAACFAMMVEDVGLTFTSAFVPAFTSALIAYGCSLVFGIAPTHFALTAPELNVRTALLVIPLGVACAAVFPPVLLHPPLHGAHRAKASPEPVGAGLCGRRAGRRLFLSLRRGAV